MRQAISTAEAGKFEIEERDVIAPDPGWIGIRVRATGICGSDLHAVHEPALWRTGHVPGHEFTGEVETVGQGVEGWAAGDRVAIFPAVICGRCGNCRSGRWQLCDEPFEAFGLTRPGGFSEQLSVPANTLFTCPV